MRLFISSLIFLFILTSGCAQFNQKLESNWSQKMQGLASSYNALLPLMYDDHSYTHPKNEKKVQMHLENIVEDSQAISDHIGNRLSGSDPFFKISLKQLRQTTKGALKNFEAKNFSYSQKLIQNSINYCFKCHTRSSGGIAFIDWDNFQLPKNISPIEQSRILIATRQFNKAEKILEDFVSKKPYPKDEEVIESIKNYLIVSLRYKSSPEQAKSMINKVEKKKDFSKKTRSLLKSWKSSLTAWMQSQEKGNDLNLNSLLKKTMSFSKDSDCSFVVSLRRSLILHKGLEQAKDYYQRAKIYHKLGKIYSHHPEAGLWDLADTYYETCIHLVPHTKIAEKCYYSLEEKINQENYSKKGVYLPRREKDYLLRLKAMTRENPIPGSSY